MYGKTLVPCHISKAVAFLMLLSMVIFVPSILGVCAILKAFEILGASEILEVPVSASESFGVVDIHQVLQVTELYKRLNWGYV